ncbi:MAG: helix-turn-helix transcriptional regulator [Clostridiales bacterium]|nr:helix-turn-helix transcriptional regulator [Clostridiales bacterium]
MGKQSTRKNKNIYQLCREAQGFTREKASENMTGVSASRIEKIEYELQEPTPYDIIQMADCYKRPDLCNYYCSHKCTIGDRYVPEVEISELSTIILETIASLNEINPLTSRLIQIARDGKISDDEIKDFVFISKKLDEVSLAIDSLNLWVDKTASENGINIELLNVEKEKLRVRKRSEEAG